MKVKLVKEHELKVCRNFEEHAGKVFEVVKEIGNLGNGGYTVDLAPLGWPGVYGWMYDDEVEVVDDSTPISVIKTKEKRSPFWIIAFFIKRFPENVKEWFVKLFARGEK